MTSFLQARAFVNAKVTSCADNRKTTLKKLPTVRATILGFHCHAIKNKIANHSIQKVPNLGNKRR